MTGLSLPQWQVVLRWADGVRSVTRYTGPLWIGPMTQGVHQLALACYAQRRATTPDLPERMPYLILSFTPLALVAGTMAAVKAASQEQWNGEPGSTVRDQAIGCQNDVPRRSHTALSREGL